MTAFIDTNVLIYAHGSDEKSETARQAILAGGVISVQVLNEFAAVLRRKFSLEWDVNRGRPRRCARDARAGSSCRRRDSPERCVPRPFARLQLL